MDEYIMVFPESMAFCKRVSCLLEKLANHQPTRRDEEKPDNFCLSQNWCSLAGMAGKVQQDLCTTIQRRASREVFLNGRRNNYIWLVVIRTDSMWFQRFIWALTTNRMLASAGELCAANCRSKNKKSIGADPAHLEFCLVGVSCSHLWLFRGKSTTGQSAVVN